MAPALTIGALTLAVVTVAFTFGMDATFDRVLHALALQGESCGMTVNVGALRLESWLRVCFVPAGSP